MRMLNSAQAAAGREMHLCPLQFDIADRAILQFSMPEETVFDPFAGIMTVPYCAVRLGRKGIGIELNTRYYEDGIWYLRAAEEEIMAPTLFDLEGVC
jgi:DNA modification methylase